MARQRTQSELVPEFCAHMPLSKVDTMAYPKHLYETSWNDE